MILIVILMDVNDNFLFILGIYDRFILENEFVYFLIFFFFVKDLDIGDNGCFLYFIILGNLDFYF